MLCLLDAYFCIYFRMAVSDLLMPKSEFTTEGAISFFFGVSVLHVIFQMIFNL